MQLGAAITELAFENVPSQALTVDAHEDGFSLHGNAAAHFDPDSAHADCQMRLGIHDRRIREEVKLAVFGWQLDRKLSFDEFFALAAVFDQILDSAHFDAVHLTEGGEVGQARHAPLGGHNLADHRRRLQSRQADQINAALCVPGPHEYSAFPRAQSWDMAFTDYQIVRRCAVINTDLDGARAIIGRRACRDTGPCVDVRCPGCGLGVYVASR